MRRSLPRVACAGMVMSLVFAPLAWAAPARALEPAFLMRLWSAIEIWTLRVSNVAEKDGSLMDPDGRLMTSEGGSQVDPHGQTADEAHLYDGSLMDPDG